MKEIIQKYIITRALYKEESREIKAKNWDDAAKQLDVFMTEQIPDGFMIVNSLCYVEYIGDEKAEMEEMPLTPEMEKLYWNYAVKNCHDLISDAWRGIEWEDLPKDVQMNFRKFIKQFYGSK